MTLLMQSKNRNNIKRDIGRHILNSSNFNIKRRESSVFFSVIEEGFGQCHLAGPFNPANPAQVRVEITR